MTTTLYDADNVQAYETSIDSGALLIVVSDKDYSEFRLVFSHYPDNTIAVRVDAPCHDNRPDFGTYTHDLMLYCKPSDDVSISDSGLLSVFARSPWAPSSVDFRSGFTLQMSARYVEPVRLSINRVRSLAAELAAASAALVEA
jgi:hypothetical protein